MRPILLKMSAFGPFPNSEEIDFSKLGSNPLFLINGPTGSGKTSILDAICFALYGKSTGDEREASQMRCDLAPEEILTEVEFIFELAAKKYRIKRVPEQQRPKSRGKGTTSQAAQASLIQLLEDNQEKLLVSSKVTEATAEIEKLTGLNADQFRQVMVLPQGKFRQLLMAESKDREQIFSKLFQTQIYRHLEERLKIQSSQIRRSVEDQQTISRGILEGVSVEDQLALEQELDQLLPKWKMIGEEKDKKQKHFLNLSNQLQAAINLVVQFKRWEETKEKAKKLNEQKQEHQQNESQLKRDADAQKIFPLKKDLSRLIEEIKNVERDVITIQELESSTKKKLEVSAKEVETINELSKELDNKKKELTVLNGYSERSEKLAKIRQSLHEAKEVEQKAALDFENASQSLNNAISQKETLETAISELQLKLKSLTEDQLELSKLQDLVKHKTELENLNARLAEEQKKLNQAEISGKQLAENQKQAEHFYHELKTKWHLGQAAILANELEENKPCPVCGSSIHPSPAHSLEALPSQEDLENAEKRRLESHNALTSAREVYVEIKSNEKNILQEINKIQINLESYADKSLGDLKQEYQYLNSKVKKLLEQQKELDVKNTQLKVKKDLEEGNRKKAELSQKVLFEKKSEFSTIKTQEETAKQELPEAYQQPDALEKDIVSKNNEIKKLDIQIIKINKHHEICLGDWKSASASLKAVEEQLRKLTELKTKTEQSWKLALEKSEFSSEVDFLEALLSEKQQSDLKTKIKSYETEVSENEGLLKDFELTLKNQQKPNLEKLESDLEKARTDKEKSENEWQGIENRRIQLRAAKDKLNSVKKNLDSLNEEYAVVGTLSDVVNGQTGNKISLQRFVLSVLLDDVLVEATRRLKIMSKGRYQLLRKEDKTKGNKASGLDLEVEDSYSGKVRPVATLSGGESFMASLAIALGMSDVVQAYAGGIRLDTLFIDEGFGSLDPESLDLAIRTLIDLQTSGRMIGVISHVADLKEQIATRIDVSSDHKGSKIYINTV